MLKLYQRINNVLHYWETWEQDERTAIVHWGTVGQQGKSKEVKNGFFSSFRKTIQREADSKRREGYVEVNDEDMVFLEVVYTIDGFGTGADLDKRHGLEEYLDELLSWTGLGHVDGGSTGSGTMEVGCVVVDFEIARNVIEASLEYSIWGDYVQIHRMED